MRLSVKTLPDRVVGEMINLSYNLDNEVFLTPDNLLETLGDPRTLDTGFPVTEDGLILYGGTDPQDLVQQNEQPIPFKQHSYAWRTLETDGSPPPDPAMVDSDIAKLKAPRTKLFNATSGGFKSATYDLYYGGFDAAGNSTLLSPGFNIPKSAITNGQDISMTMPSIPAQWSSFGWWISWNGGVPYLQTTIDLERTRPDTFDLTGPYRWIRKAPDYNETYLGRGPDASNLAYFTWTPYSLQAGAYKLFPVLVTSNGESLPSDPAKAYTWNVSTTQNNKGLQVFHPKSRSGAIGWRLYALQSDGRYYVVYPGTSNPDRPLGFDEVVNVYSFDPSNWPVDSTGAYLDTGVALSNFDPTTAVDTSGLSDPQDAPGPNVPDTTYNSFGVFGGSGLDDTVTQDYYAALSATIGGIEGPRGDAARVKSVPPGQGIRIYPPKQVQKLRNAEQTETDTSGLPLDLFVANAAVTGATVTSQPGFTQVALNNIAATSATPTVATTPVDLKDDTGAYYSWVIQGELQVSSYAGVTPGATGEARVQLEQYAVTSDAWIAASTKPAAIAGATIDLTLETNNVKIDQTGSERFEKTVLPTDNFWNPTALSARLVAYTPLGSTRSLTWTVVDLGMHPQEHTPEKFSDGDVEQGIPDDADPPPETHHNEGPNHKRHKHRRKNHPRKGRALPMPDRPTSPGVQIRDYTFESGEDRSLLVPTGSPVINSTAAINGTGGFLAQDSSTSVFNPVYYTETFFDNRTWLGVEPAIKVQALPTAGTVDILRVLDQNGATMASYTLSSTGTLTLSAISVTGSIEWSKDVAHTSGGNAIANGDIITPEAVLTGGTGDAGLVRGWYWNSRNFGVYSLVASNESDKNDLDWSNRRPTAYQFGLISMSSVTATCTLYFDNIIVTENGSTNIRDRTGSGQVIYMGTSYVPDHAGQPVRQDILPRHTRVAAKPSTWYAYGFYSRWTGLQRNNSPFHISGVLLDGGSKGFGPPYGGGPISGKHGWAEYVNVFQTPEDCYELVISGRDIHVGKIKWQELALTELDRPPLSFISDSTTETITTSDVHGLSNGNVVKVMNQGGQLPSGLDIATDYYVINATSTTLQLAFVPGGSAVNITAPGTGIQYLLRDLPKRTDRRATSGSLRSTFDTDTPMRGMFAPNIPRNWTKGGVVVKEQPAGTDVATTFRSSNATFNYSLAYPDILTTPQNKYLEISATLTGDGFFSPVLSGDSPYVEQTLRVATLLREDGSEFPGGVIVTSAQVPTNLPNVEVRTKLDKRVERHIIAAPLGSLAAFKLQLFTDEAVREIMETWLLPSHFFRIEYRGKAVTIKPREQIEIKQEPDKQYKSVDPVLGTDYYYVYAQADVTGAEIVIEADL